MSTATAFVSIGSFPFCPYAAVGVVNYVDNLTLAQVMAFYWNLENFTISLTGTATKGAETLTMTGTFTLNPAGFSGSLLNQGDGNDSFWLGDAFGTVVFASFPSVRQPRERVCVPAFASSFISLYLSHSSASGLGFIEFYFTTDPINSGKFRIYYDFFFEGETPTTEAKMMFTGYEPRIAGAGLTPITSGTITIGGVTMNYWSGEDSTSFTGGTMSATSSDFTY